MNEKSKKKLDTAIKAKKIVDKILDGAAHSKVYQLRDDLTDEEMMLALRDYLINQRLTCSNGTTLKDVGYKNLDLWKEQDL